MRLCVVIVAALALHGCIAWKFKPGFPKRMPTATVSLDDAPDQRWTNIINTVVATSGWNSTYGQIHTYWENQIPNDLKPIVLGLADMAEKVLDPELLGEMKGVFAAVNALAPAGQTFKFGILIALNMMYELSAGCTSIAAEDTSGVMWHSRNLDWGTVGTSFSNLTYLVTYTRGGSVVFSSVHFIGFLGSLTGMKNNGFSITIDERDLNDPLQILLNVIRLEDKQGMEVSWLVRKTLETQTTYSAALAAVSKTNISAPVYYIVSGLTGDQGSIVTRNWDNVPHGVLSIPSGPLPWYVVETNYDYWTNPPASDNRRGVAETALAKLGQAGINADGLFQIMQTPGNATSRGVLNDMTLYTVVISANSNHFDAYLMQ